jgi:hypothetical protein
MRVSPTPTSGSTASVTVNRRAPTVMYACQRFEGKDWAHEQLPSECEQKLKDSQRVCSVARK